MSEYVQTVAVFLAQAMVISFSGVMAPGAITAATLAAGARSRHAGALVAVGHGIVEFPLMILIMAGMGTILAAENVKIVIGLLGGVILLLMAARMLLTARRPAGAVAAAPRRGPVLTGILLTAGNPYFLLWWATIGLRLSTEAIELGAVAFGLFAVIHWLCDLAWLEAMTLATFKGAKLLGDRTQQIILVVCGVALALIGGRFLYLAILSLRG